MTYDKSDLTGTWLLDSWTIEYPDRVTHPFGPNPVGLLCYTADGFMNASIARAERPALPAESTRAAGAAAQAEAFASFFNYGGRYTVEGDTVRHDVLVSLNPNFVGHSQSRTIERNGDQLILSAPERAPGSDHTRLHRLIWHRAGGAEHTP